MNSEMDWLADEAMLSKLKQDNKVLYEALRIAAFSVADEQDPLGNNKKHNWIEQAQKNVILPK